MSILSAAMGRVILGLIPKVSQLPETLEEADKLGVDTMGRIPPIPRLRNQDGPRSNLYARRSIPHPGRDA